MNEEKKSENKFEYSYSAPTEEERREIEDIRKLYDPAPKTEDKLETLRKLNRRVTEPPKAVAAVISVSGLLVFGLGMTFILEWALLVWGIVVSVLGAAILCIIYPVYQAILKRNKKKYGQQILDLSDELLNHKDEKDIG